MGISGLLPFLKAASRPANVKEFSGATVAIDCYCWLHKGAFGCAEQLARGQYTDGYVKYIMKYVNLLLYHNIKPILVFDGRNLPSKSETEKKRRSARKENRERAVQLLKEGRRDEAREFFQRCVDVTPAMARAVIEAAQERNIDCIVAPYEADAQLAFLNMCGLAQYVITEDSDLTLFGCDRVLFKLKDTGDCVLYSRSLLGKVFGQAAASFSFEKFRYLCIMAGCDYLDSLPGIGLVKARNFWQKVTNPDLAVVLRKIPAYLNMPNVVVSQEYVAKFVRANRTFLHQVVFDPVRREEVHLTPLPDSLKEQDLSYCGSFSPAGVAQQLALGNLDLHTLTPMSHFCPDSRVQFNPKDKPKYGARTQHPSVWRSDSPSTPQVMPSGGIQEELPPVLKEPFKKVTVVKVEKRKLEKVVREVIAEENIAELLDSPCSPPLKRLRPGVPSEEKMRRMLGDTAPSGAGALSGYFSGPARGEAERGRSSVAAEDSGAWFSGLEQSASAEGKFIYRPQLGETAGRQDDQAGGLDSRTDTPRRNPFAKKPPCSSLEMSPADTQDSGCSSLPSSQLSIYSIDPESVTFTPSSSQEGDQEARSQERIKEASSPEVIQEVTSLAKEPPSLGPSIRLGLSKFAASPRQGLGGGGVSSPAPRLGGVQSSTSSTAPRLGGVQSSTSSPAPRLGGVQSSTSSPAPRPKAAFFTSTSSVTKSSTTKLGPARVSGLCRPSKPSSGVLKQGSLLNMFARTVKKADLGPPSSS